MVSRLLPGAGFGPQSNGSLPSSRDYSFEPPCTLLCCFTEGTSTSLDFGIFTPKDYLLSICISSLRSVGSSICSLFKVSWDPSLMDTEGQLTFQTQRKTAKSSQAPIIQCFHSLIIRTRTLHPCRGAHVYEFYQISDSCNHHHRQNHSVTPKTSFMVNPSSPHPGNH
jgi:hypothetical protein